MILVLFDHQGRCRSLQSGLQRAGAKVFCAETPDAVPEMMERTKADLAVLVDPPDDLAPAIRKRAPRAGVIALAGDDLGVLARALSLLGDGFARAGRREPALILCVDDEAFFLQALERLLHKSGYHVVTAPSAEEARARLRDVRPDLAIVDVMLPGADGLALVDELRRLYGEDYPVVLLTGRSTDEDIAEGYRHGASYYICKPCPPKQILGIVDYLVGNLGETERQILETQL